MLFVLYQVKPCFLSLPVLNIIKENDIFRNQNLTFKFCRCYYFILIRDFWSSIKLIFQHLFRDFNFNIENLLS